MNSQDDLGKTALMLACESGNSELIKTILNHRPRCEYQMQGWKDSSDDSRRDRTT